MAHDPAMVLRCEFKPLPYQKFDGIDVPLDDSEENQ